LQVSPPVLSIFSAERDISLLLLLKMSVCLKSGFSVSRFIVYSFVLYAEPASKTKQALSDKTTFAVSSFGLASVWKDSSCGDIRFVIHTLALELDLVSPLFSLGTSQK